MDYFLDLINWLTSWNTMKVLEVSGVVFSIISVILAYYNRVSLYFFGILSTSIYIYLYLHPLHKLYAESALSLYYLIMSFIGWYQWVNSKKEGKKELPITFTHSKEWLISASICIVSFIIIYSTLILFTDSDVPILDALVACFAWSGMWLLTKRKVENWLVLNISNLIAIPLLAYKGLYPTVLLTIIQFIIAILGYYKWKKAALQDSQATLSF